MNMKSKELTPLPGIIPAIDMINFDKCFEIAKKIHNLEGISALKIGSLPVCEYGFKEVSKIPGNKIYDAQKGASDIPYIVENKLSR